MKSINTKTAKAMIDSIDNGQFFGVTFEKADGTIREMNCRKGVKKYLKGGKATYNGTNSDKGNIGVYDMITGAYRCFNINRLKKLRIRGVEYTISE